MLTEAQGSTSKLNGLNNGLRAYLLGTVNFEAGLALQRRLLYDVAGGDSPCLILCEHEPILTIGRHGSRRHLLFDDLNGSERRRVRWVNRGGGCWLQTPGQLAIYPILPLRRIGLTIREYLVQLKSVIAATLGDFDIAAELRAGSMDVWASDRPIACLGIAVRSWVSYYGAVLNICPDLLPYRLVRSGTDHPTMTSMERERRGPVRSALVRQRLVERFADQFGFAETALFTDHPSLKRKARRDALVAVA